MSMSWSPSSMVKLMRSSSSSSGGLPPVWIMPVFSGTTACFDKMIASYSASSAASSSPFLRTIYGLTDAYLTGLDDALTMAWDEWIATYVDAIKTKQKDGPYTLVGYSQGMHWCYAVGEALRKKGDQVAEMIILDPNFPAWNFADRVANWDGPQVAAAMGAPQFVAKTFMGCFMVPSLKKGAKWETAAAREKTVSTALAAMTKDPANYEAMIIHTEMDTDVTIVDNPLDAVTAIPPEQRTEKVSKMIADKFDGLDAAFVRRVIDFRGVSALRWVNYVPEKVPVGTKVYIAFADRAHFNAYSKQYSVEQGFDRFHERGMDQIEEHIFKMDTKCKPGSVDAKWKGMMVAFELHFRFMHAPTIWEQLKTNIWTKIGML